MVTKAERDGCTWRRIAVRTSDGRILSATFPNRNDIESLQVGDFAPSCFGHDRRVVGIFGRGTDDRGKAFVCYYTEFGDGARISSDATEDEMHDGICWKVGSLHSEMERLRVQGAQVIAEAGQVRRTRYFSSVTYETRVQELEQQGLTRSDAQAVVDAQERVAELDAKRIAAMDDACGVNDREEL